MKSTPLSLIVYVLFVLSFALACKSDNKLEQQIEPTPFIKKKAEKLSIVIQPFNDLPPGTVELVASQLKAIYSGTIVVKSPIPLPTQAFQHSRSRYRADSLIDYLGRMVGKNELIIGLTSSDISTTKGNISDWGVMGLGYCPGKSCIASSFRLKGTNRQEKLFKVAIHELGHTQGLAKTQTRHCPDKTCYMRDAEGKDHINELTHFCSTCKPVLVKAGWALK
jgi:archaemetzincin